MKRNQTLNHCLTALALIATGLTSGNARASDIDPNAWLWDTISSSMGNRSAIFMTTADDIAKQHDLENAISNAAGWGSMQDVARNTPGTGAGNQAAEIAGVPSSPELAKAQSKYFIPNPKTDEPSAVILRWLGGYDLDLSRQVKTHFETEVTTPSNLSFLSSPVTAETPGVANVQTAFQKFGEVMGQSNLDDAVSKTGAFFTKQMIQGSDRLRCDYNFNENLRDALSAEVENSYPSKRTVTQSEDNPAGRVAWILNSYRPLASDTAIKTIPNSMANTADGGTYSKGRYRILLPAPAQIVTSKIAGPDGQQIPWYSTARLVSVSQVQNPPIQTAAAVFHRVDLMARRPRDSRIKFRPVVELEFDKDYRNEHLNELNVTARFGEINPEGEIDTSAADCNLADIMPISYENPEAALVVRGYVDAKGIFPNAKAPTKPTAVPTLTERAAAYAKAKIYGEIDPEIEKIENEFKGTVEQDLAGTEISIVIHQLKVQLTRTKDLPRNPDGSVIFDGPGGAEARDAPFDHITVDPKGTSASVILYFPEKYNNQVMPFYKLFNKLKDKGDKNVLQCGQMSGPNGNDGLNRCAVRFDTADAAGGTVSKLRGLMDSKIMANVLPQLAAAIEPQANGGLKQFDSAVDAAQSSAMKLFHANRAELEAKIRTLLAQAPGQASAIAASPSPLADAAKKLQAAAKSVQK